MNEFKLMSHKWEFLIRQEFYVMGLVLNGLPEVETPAIKEWLGNERLVREFSSGLGLSERAWVERRTCRQFEIDCSRLESDLLNLESIAESLNTLLKKISLPVVVKKLTSGERLNLAESLRTQANLSGSSGVLGFYMKPDSFVDVRGCWVVIGLLAQVLCVVGQKFGKGVFITHGIDRATLSESLSTLEYIVAFE